MVDITSKQLPIISKECLMRIVANIVPKPLGPECTTWHMGYEAAKAEIANHLAAELGMGNLQYSPAIRTLQALKEMP